MEPLQEKVELVIGGLHIGSSLRAWWPLVESAKK
jgi:hypothetical protein